MTVHVGEYSKTIRNLTWLVEMGSEAGDTPVSDIDTLAAGDYTFVPDVHDDDNLGFGDKLPKITVTVKDASTGEDPKGE